MVEKSRWIELTEQNPDHSAWYIQRFRDMAAAGDDLDGEARLIDAMAPRGARILDAGCGPGRVGGRLGRLGHRVVGVDVDPALIDAARADHPGPIWLVGDLAELDLRGVDLPDLDGEDPIGDGFDVIVCAGNVATFLAPGTRGEVLRRLGVHLAPEGRLVIGFGAGRGYEFDEFRRHATEAGLRIQLELATWDLRAMDPESDFLVAVLGR